MAHFRSFDGWQAAHGNKLVAKFTGIYPDKTTSKLREFFLEPGTLSEIMAQAVFEDVVCDGQDLELIKAAQDSPDAPAPAAVAA